MNLPSGLLALSLVVVLSGCSGLKVSTDYDEQHDFSSIKTWNWQYAKQPETGDKMLDNPLRDARIRRSVAQVLKEKGQNQQAASPDVLVSYEFKVQTREKTSSMGIFVGTGTWGSSGGVSIGAGGPVSTRSTPYQVGTLIIDILDASDKSLLWRGSGQATLDDEKDATGQEQDMLEAIRKIMASYPPKKKAGAE